MRIGLGSACVVVILGGIKCLVQAYLQRFKPEHNKDLIAENKTSASRLIEGVLLLTLGAGILIFSYKLQDLGIV